MLGGLASTYKKGKGKRLHKEKKTLTRPMPFLTLFSAHSRRNKPSSGVSLLSLPNEILHRILSCLSTPDLLAAWLATPRFHDLALVIVSRRGCRLRLCFDQESRWRFAVDMTLASATAAQFAFVPMPADHDCLLYASRMLRRPVLYKVLLTEHDPGQDRDEAELDILGSSVAVNVRHVGGHSKRILNGAEFSYSVARRETRSSKRPGERELLPLELKCSPVWLCPRRKTLNRMFHAFR